MGASPWLSVCRKLLSGRDLADRSVEDVVEEGHSLRLEEDSPLALTNPVHEVLFNEDILPEIIFQFKSLFEGENGWKQPVSRLLVVSKAVFYAGLCILWQSMDSLKPAFKLLPWFTKPKYEGLGVNIYRSVLS